MVKRTWQVVILLTTIMLLLPVSSVFAAGSATDFTTWPAKTTTEVKKVWSVTFNSVLARASLSNNTLYILNSKQAKLSTTIGLSTDGLTATVTPNYACAAGDYKLYITNGITSLEGKKLTEQIIVPFTVEVGQPASSTPSTPSTPSTYILNVDSDFKSYVTELNVLTAPDVYKVNVNKTKMQYLGDNKYNAGIFGLKEGSTILLEAYDQNGKLLQSYNYKLE